MGKTSIGVILDSNRSNSCVCKFVGIHREKIRIFQTTQLCRHKEGSHSLYQSVPCACAKGLGTLHLTHIYNNIFATVMFSKVGYVNHCSFSIMHHDNYNSFISNYATQKQYTHKPGQWCLFHPIPFAVLQKNNPQNSTETKWWLYTHGVIVHSSNVGVLLEQSVDTFVAVTTVAICIGRTVEAEDMLTTMPRFFSSIGGSNSLVIYDKLASKRLSHNAHVTDWTWT